MKNEKMKRVAALALAGTIAASTVSPAAFADEIPPVEKFVTPTETTAPEEKAAPATVESAKEVDKGEMPVAPGGLMNEVGSAIEQKVEESGLTKDDVTEDQLKEISGAMQEVDSAVQDNSHIVAVNPTIPSTEGNVPLPEGSGIAIGSEGLIMTPVEESDTENPPEIEEEVPVDTDGLLGVYDVESMLGDMQDAVDKVGDENPLKAPVEEALEELEGELPDVIIGEDPRPVMQPMDGQEDEVPATPVTPPEDFGTHGINPGVVQPAEPVVTDREDFDEDTAEGLKDESTAAGIEATLESTDPMDGLTGFEKLQQAVDAAQSDSENKPASIEIGGKEYEISDFTIVGKDDQSDGWVTDNDQSNADATVQHRDYTFSLSSRGDDEWEKNPLQPSEVAELLGIEMVGEETKNEDGTVTFQGSDGNLYTITKNLGTVTDNQVTSVSWQVKVTETKTTHHESENVLDKVEITDGPTYAETIVTDSEGTVVNEGFHIVEGTQTPGLTNEEIQNYLKDGTVPDGYATVTGDDGVTKLVSNTNENISYTINTTVLDTISMTNEQLLAIAGQEDGQAQIQALLGDKFTVENGKILYTDDENETHEVTFAESKVGQVLAVTIVKTDEHGAETGVKVGENQHGVTIGADGKVNDSALHNEVESEATQDMLKQALAELAEAENSESVTYNESDNTYSVTVGGKSYTLKKENDQWVTTIGDYTYKLNLAGPTSSKEETVAATPSEGHSWEQTVTVTGDAWVESGIITWTGTYGPTYGNQDDQTEYEGSGDSSGLSKLFNANNKPKFDGDNGAEITHSQDSFTNGETFNDETVSKVSVEGNKYTITTTTSEGSTKTYEFTYAAVDAAETVGTVTGNANGVGGTKGDVTVTGDLTKLTWTVKTTTPESKEDITNDVLDTDNDDTLSDVEKTLTSGNVTAGENNSYVLGGKTLVWDATDECYYASDDTDKKQAYYVDEETVTDLAENFTADDIAAMLRKKGVAVTAENVTIKANGTASYTANGQTVDMTFTGGKVITVTEKVGDLNISASSADSNAVEAKAQAINNIKTELSTVYSGNDGTKVKEYEEYLESDEYKEFAAQYKTTYGIDLNPYSNDAYGAFANYLDKNGGIKEGVVDYGDLEGDDLVDFLEKSIYTDNKHWDGGVKAHFDLAVEPDLELKNGAQTNCVIMNDVTVRTGTLENLVKNYDSNYEFKLQDEIGNQGQGYFEYTRDERNNWNWLHNFTEDNSYYRMTGTVAYVSEEGKENHSTLFAGEYKASGKGQNKVTAEEAARNAALNDGLDPDDLTYVTFTDKDGKQFVKIYDSTAELDTYGYLTEASNQCENGYDLVVDKMAMSSTGTVIADYEGITTYSASLTKIKDAGTGKSLTVSKLEANIAASTTTNSTGNRTSGSYTATQALKVTKENTTGGSAAVLLDGNDGFVATQDDARFQGTSNGTYTLYKEWLTTTDTYNAQANQYGKVTTTTTGDDGTTTTTEDKAKIEFDYDTVAYDAAVESKTEQTIQAVYAELNRTPAPTENPDGPGGGGDEEEPLLPPVEENPDEGPTLILTDVPTEEEIADEATALAAGPETEEADIEEEETPLAAAPETEEAEIGDDEVAKSAVPKTGDESGIFLLMSMISGMALAALSFIDRKGRHSRFGSQH